jgi:hypothetical protein
MAGVARGFEKLLKALGFGIFMTRQVAESFPDREKHTGIRLSHLTDAGQSTTDVNIDDIEELPVRLGPQFR